jgi:flavodoxin I
MKTMVVYDSVFGNTEKIALEMGKALSSKVKAGVFRVVEVKLEQLKGVELLIVGSPTRAFSPTPATVAFLKKIPTKGLEGVKVAAFDTRMPMNDQVPGILKFMAKIFGYAAKPIVDRLEKKGGSLLVPPEGFFVDGSEGPLAKGELERAAKWAKAVGKG